MPSTQFHRWGYPPLLFKVTSVPLRSIFFNILQTPETLLGRPWPGSTWESSHPHRHLSTRRCWTSATTTPSRGGGSSPWAPWARPRTAWWWRTVSLLHMSRKAINSMLAPPPRAGQALGREATQLVELAFDWCFPPLLLPRQRPTTTATGNE